MTHSEFLADEQFQKEFISKLVTLIRSDPGSYERALSIVTRGEFKGFFDKIKYGNIYNGNENY